MDRSMPNLTVLETPTDLGIRASRSNPTLVGHAPTGSSEPQAAPSSPRPPRPGPWTETVYISPSGRIFLPPGYAFEGDQPSALEAHRVRREPAPPQPEPYRAHAVIGQVAPQAPRAPQAAPIVPRPRTITRESWVVPPHLRQAG